MMTVDEILHAIERPGRDFPFDAVTEAMQRREEMTEPLLGVLQHVLQHPEAAVDDQEYMAHLFALYLLAQFREPRAYPLVVQVARIDPLLMDDIFGDFVSEGLPEVLASVCNGNLDPIKALIEDDAVEEYVRDSALTALQIRFAAGDLSREALVSYLAELWRGRLTREPSQIWNKLISVSTDMYPDQFMEDIEAAYEEELAEEYFIDLGSVLEIVQQDRVLYISRLPQNEPVYVQDTIEEMAWWSCFDRSPKHPIPHFSKRKRKDVSSLFFNAAFPNGYHPNRSGLGSQWAQPPRRQVKIGPNDPCPCGSAKKYKKCCGRLGG